MATHDSALSDLSEMLVATDATLSTSLAEILTVAIQELIEAELTARIGADSFMARLPLVDEGGSGRNPG